MKTAIIIGFFEVIIGLVFLGVLLIYLGLAAEAIEGMVR